MRWSLVVLLLASACAGDDAETELVAQPVKKQCKQHKHKHKKDHGDCETTTQTIGVSGGTITTSNGLKLEIPFGALDGDTQLTVTTTDLAPPGGVGAVSPVYEFQPEGIVFASPIKVTLPLPKNIAAASVYWSQLNGTGFDAIGGTIDGTTITVETVHFSLAVIGSPSSTRTVTGCARDTWISATTRESLPSDLHTGPIEALVDDGSGNLVAIAGSYAADGTFTIPDVPVGQYILHAQSIDQGDVMIVTSSNSPDLGRKLGGAPRSQRTELTSETLLHLTVNNLEPWQDGDSVELWSTQRDNWWFQAELDQPPALGATSHTFDLDMRFNNNTFYPAEIRPGDQFTVAQLTAQTSTTGATYQAMSRFATRTDVSVSDGVDSNVTVDLVPMTSAPTETLNVDFRGRDWVQALRNDGFPGATTCQFCGGFVGALAQAGYARDGFYTANADLMLMYDMASAGTDIVSGNLIYPQASSLGGQWESLYVARWGRRHLVVLPGSSGPGAGTSLGSGMQWTTTKTGIEAAPITPRLTPPRNVKVNGSPWFGGGPTVGATTTISWDPPAVGVAQFYIIRAHELFLRPNGRTGGFVAQRVATPETSFTFPAEMLDPSLSYAFTITAMASTSADPQQAAKLLKAPYKLTNELADATVSSGIFGAGEVIFDPDVVRGHQQTPFGITQNGTHLYWVEKVDPYGYPATNSFAGNIWQAELDGSNAQIIASGQASPFYIAATDTTVYWTNQGDYINDAGLIAYDLATGSMTTLVADMGIENLTVAPSGDVVFTSAIGVEVFRVATGVRELLAAEPAVDVATDGTNVYFTQFGDGAPAATGRVLSVPLAGGAVTELATNQPQAWDIETDGTNVYWTAGAFNQPYATTLNSVPVGGGPATVLFSDMRRNLATITVGGGYVYFVTDNSLKRVPTSGGAMHSVAYSQNSCTGSLTARGGRVGWTDMCSGAVYVSAP